MGENLLSLQSTRVLPRTSDFKVIELKGNIKISGRIEIPSNIALADIVYGIGGGMKEGQKFKAIKLGGASGIFLNSDCLNITVDSTSLAKVNFTGRLDSIEVIDNSACIIELAKSSINGAIGGLCGKCVPCREGTKRLLDILERIAAGIGSTGDLELMQDLISTISEASLCRLGKISVNPLESALRYFKNDFIYHISHKSCKAMLRSMDQSRINETIGWGGKERWEAS